MNPNRYTLAAWMSFASAALVLPTLLVTFLSDAGHIYMLPFMSLMNLFSAGITIYVMIKFLELLRIEYNCRKLDIPVYISIIMGTFATLLGIILRALGVDGASALLFMALPLAPMAIAGIVIGVRLLAIPTDLYNLRKPLGILYIISSVSYLTLFLIPLGMVIGIVESILLGMVFLRANTVEVPEFV